MWFWSCVMCVFTHMLVVCDCGATWQENCAWVYTCVSTWCQWLLGFALQATQAPRALLKDLSAMSWMSVLHQHWSYKNTPEGNPGSRTCMTDSQGWQPETPARDWQSQWAWPRPCSVFFEWISFFELVKNSETKGSQGQRLVVLHAWVCYLRFFCRSSCVVARVPTFHWVQWLKGKGTERKKEKVLYTQERKPEGSNLM